MTAFTSSLSVSVRCACPDATFTCNAVPLWFVHVEPGALVSGPSGYVKLSEKITAAPPRAASNATASVAEATAVRVNRYIPFLPRPKPLRRIEGPAARARARLCSAGLAQGEDHADRLRGHQRAALAAGVLVRRDRLRVHARDMPVEEGDVRDPVILVRARPAVAAGDPAQPDLLAVDHVAHRLIARPAQHPVDRDRFGHHAHELRALDHGDLA